MSCLTFCPTNPIKAKKSVIYGPHHKTVLPILELKNLPAQKILKISIGIDY